MCFDKKNWNPLAALLKKHLIERLRCYARTVSELLSAVLVYLVLLLLEIAMLESESGGNKVTVRRSNSDDEARVIFTPDNKYTRKLMSYICSENVTSALSNLNIICEGFPNRTEMLKYLSIFKVLDYAAVIIFENVQDRIPDTLSYSIQYPDETENNTSKFKDLYANSISKVPNVTFYSNLQWAVDKAYMEHLSGQPVDHNIELVGQPYSSIHLRRVKSVIMSYMIPCSVLAPIPFFLFSASRYIEEKRSGLKGIIHMHGVSPSTIRLAHLLDSVVFSVVYTFLVTLMLKVSHRIPVLEHSNVILVSINTMLHMICNTALAFVVSAVSQDVQHADSIVLLTYVLTVILNTFWYSLRDNKSLKVMLISCILPHAPVFLFWDEVGHLEISGVGLKYSNLFYESAPHHVPVILAWFFAGVQLFILCVLTWYLDYVFPGKYGVPLKWNFCFQKNFWKPTLSKKKGKKRRNVNFHVTSEKETNVFKDNRFFERGPHNAEIAIKMSKVTKIFRGFRHSTTALDNVNLDVYRGEITMLLGINGAGKTTLLSIVAGLYKSTKGSVYVNGLDTVMRFKEINKDMGFCPQGDITFSYLTVLENIIFFERLRGKEESNAGIYMEKLGLTDKADFYSHQLDTGGRRCLQVACSLVGDSDVLVLDEPTSNMDPESRHGLWDLLLLLRGSKTIFIATSGMEEADALGDRIALLCNGKLKCHGSPAFLKQAIGADFKLTLTIKHHKPFVKQIVKVLDDVIPELTRSMISSKQDISKLSIGLPAKARELFPKVFDALEDRRRELGISSISVGMSMEEVFLRFVEQDDPDTRTYDTAEFDHYEQMEKLKGCRLWLQQMQVLTERSFTYIWAHKIKFLILQVLVPFVGLLVVTLSSNSETGYGSFHSPHSHSNQGSVVLFHAGPVRKSDVLTPLKKRYPDTTFVLTDDISHDYVKFSTDPDKETIHDVYGYSIEDKRTVVYIPDPTKVTLSKTMNIMSNMFISLHMPYATEHGIVARHSPMSDMLREGKKLFEPKKVYVCVAWATWVSFLITITLPPFILLSVEEYYTGVRFRHLTAGCSAFIIWYSKLAVHVLIYSIVIPPSLLFAAGLLDVDKTINRPDYLGALFTFLLAFGPTFMMHLYVLSFLLHPEHVIAQINIMTLFFSILTPLVGFVSYSLQEQSMWLRIVTLIFYILSNISPACTLTSGLIKLSLTARENSFCAMNYKHCATHLAQIQKSMADCCNSTTPARAIPYYMTNTGLTELLTFLIQFLCYSLMVILLQTRILQRLLDHIVNCRYKAPPPVTRSDQGMLGLNVEEETRFVAEKCTYLKSLRLEERIEDPVVFLADNIHKKCKSLINTVMRYRCCHVKGLSFAVRRGEVFGLVGKNGSGKSSTLKILSGYLVMTKGDSYAFGHFFRKQRQKYLRMVTFSTPMHEMDEFLTGFDNVKLLAKLHGHMPHVADHLALLYMQYMGLQAFTHCLVSSYTPGCARRLGIAGALAAASRVVLLDAPTAAVDIYSKPLVSRAILRLQERGCIVILSEQNMEWREMEQTCVRMGFLVRGQMVAIGSVQQLRSQLASGYTATIKLKIDSAYVIDDEDEDMSRFSSKSTLHATTAATIVKREFLQIFPTSELRDEHLSMLYFRIRDEDNQMQYSEIFLKLETLKSTYGEIIEDYTLSEMSIDEVIENLEQEYAKALTYQVRP